jgi:acid stress-induced BolA-like protein IbaG/YrbA
MFKVFSSMSEKLFDSEIELAIQKKTKECKLRNLNTSIEQEIHTARAARDQGNQAAYQAAAVTLQRMLNRRKSLYRHLSVLNTAEDTLTSISFEMNSARLLEGIARLAQRACKRVSLSRAVTAIQNNFKIRTRLLQHQDVLGQLSDQLMEGESGSVSLKEVEQLINTNVETEKMDPVAQLLKKRISQLDADNYHEEE